MSGSVQDVRPGWLNAARRLQSVARGHHQGYSVLRITIVVDENGNPKFWCEPEVDRFEPGLSGGQFLARVLEAMRWHG